MVTTTPGSQEVATFKDTPAEAKLSESAARPLIGQPEPALASRERRIGARDLPALQTKLGQLDKDLSDAQAKLDQHSPKDVEKNTEAYQWDLRTVKNIEDQKAAVQAGVDRLREQGTFSRPVNGLPENIEELVRTNKFKDMPEEYKRLQLQSWRDIATGNVSDKVEKPQGNSGTKTIRTTKSVRPTTSCTTTSKTT